jgi:hypothetical protein
MIAGPGEARSDLVNTFGSQTMRTWVNRADMGDRSPRRPRCGAWGQQIEAEASVRNQRLQAEVAAEAGGRGRGRGRGAAHPDRGRNGTAQRA